MQPQRPLPDLATWATLEAVTTRQADAAGDIAELLVDRARRGLMSHEVRILNKTLHFFERLSREAGAIAAGRSR